MADAQIRRLVLGYRAQTDLLRSRLLAILSRLWMALPDYHDPAVDRFVSKVVPTVEGGTATMAALTAAYLAAVKSAAVGGSRRPLPVPSVDVESLRGVPAVEVYRRPAVTLRTALSDSKPFGAAVDLGLQRLVDIASTDMQLAKTHTSRHIISEDPDAVGYRRVLEGSHSCGLCAVAATQRYHKKNLMPIHGGCDCAVLPIYARHDPGQIIDPDGLAGIHATIAERFGQSSAGARGIPGTAIEYRDVLITHEHGELGPILAVRGQHFTGPRDL